MPIAPLTYEKVPVPNIRPQTLITKKIKVKERKPKKVLLVRVNDLYETDTSLR